MSDVDPHPLAPAVSTGEEPVRTHLGWAAAVTALCFLPLGLVAVVYSLRSSRALEAGEEPKARKAARVARRWILTTVIVGVIVDGGLLAVLLLLGAFSS